MSVHSGRRAYIGSYTASGGRGIVVAEVDAETGALTEVGVADTVPDPSYLTLSDDASVLYAVSETEDGLAAAFLTSPAGDLPPLGKPRALRAEGPAHLTRAGNHLLTANYGSGTVTVLPVDGEGAPLEASSVYRHEGSGPHPDRQRGPHAHQVLADPGGQWILTVDLGTDSVRVLRLDPSSGELAAHTEIVLRGGSGPRHLAFHPGGGHAYVLHELDPSLTVCRWDAAAGVLEAVGEAPLLPAGETAESYASAIVVARDGRFVWAANRGHDSISVLALDAAHEKAELVTTVPCGGRWPRDLALDPAGSRLYAANEHSGDVTWFDIDPKTGVPAMAGSLALPAPACVIFG